MKIVITRNKDSFGGIYRRFREFTAWCQNRHEVVGVLPFSANDEPLNYPVRTLCYKGGISRSTRVSSQKLQQASSINEILTICEKFIEQIAKDLSSESPDKVFAVDTSLGAFCVVAACKYANLSVSTIIAGIKSEEARYNSESSLPYMLAVENYCLTQSNRLIFPSLLAAEHCIFQYTGIAPFSVVHNGIADSFLHAELPILNQRSRRIGAVMRLDGVKNPHALGKIADSLQQYGYSLDLITNLSPEYKQLELNFLDNICVFPPSLSDEDLLGFYGQRCALVCPSKFETYGNVAMESIAAGIPAVITDRMGVCEVYRKLGLEHLIVAVDDIEKIVERLIVAEPISLAVREHLRNEFSWGAVCSRLIED